MRTNNYKKNSAVVVQLIALVIMLFHLSVPHHTEYDYHGHMDEHVCCQAEKQACTQNTHSSHDDNCSGHCHCIGCHTIEDIPFQSENHLQNTFFIKSTFLFNSYFEFKSEFYCKTSDLVLLYRIKTSLRGPPAIHFA